MPDTGGQGVQLQTPHKWPLPCGLDGPRRESPSPPAVLASDLFSHGRWRGGGLLSRGDFQVEPPPLDCLRAAVPKVDTAHQRQTGARGWGHPAPGRGRLALPAEPHFLERKGK